MMRCTVVFGLLFSLFISIGIYAQEVDKTVTVTVSGRGKSQDEAKQSALRSAIEQAYGAFISSKTEILNDQVVTDQMASVSSGNIQTYSVLTESQLPDGTWGLTLKVKVSISKLSKFVEAKGVVIDINGGIFALNIEQQLLNEQGEVKAISEMVGLLHEPMQISLDYEIKSSEKKSIDSESKNWELPLEVVAKANKNLEFCANYFVKTLTAISLTREEVLYYKSLNKQVFPISVNFDNQHWTFHLRKEASVNVLNAFGKLWEFYARLFVYQSDLEEKIGIGEARIMNLYDYQKFIFPPYGKEVASFKWRDTKTLSEIKKMTNISVKPRGVVSQFKFGGIVIHENNEEVLVMGLTDLGRLNYNEANNACNELVLNGYDDWRMPTSNEFQHIIDNYNKNSFWGNTRAQFWTSTPIWHGTTSFHTISGVTNLNYHEVQDGNSYYVLPVRSISTNISNNATNISGENNPKESPQKQLLIYTGIYTVLNKLPGDKIEIIFTDEKLYLQYISGSKNYPDLNFEITTDRFDLFLNPIYNAKIQFKRGVDGQVNSLIFTKNNGSLIEASK